MNLIYKSVKSGFCLLNDTYLMHRVFDCGTRIHAYHTTLIITNGCGVAKMVFYVNKVYKPSITLVLKSAHVECADCAQLKKRALL